MKMNLIILAGEHHVKLDYFIHVREHIPCLLTADDVTVDYEPGFFTLDF